MTTFLMLGTTEIVVIALVIVLLFGGAKLPELMRGIGHGVRDFKNAINEKPEDEKSEGKDNKKD